MDILKEKKMTTTLKNAQVIQCKERWVNGELEITKETLADLGNPGSVSGSELCALQNTREEQWIEL